MSPKLSIHQFFNVSMSNSPYKWLTRIIRSSGLTSLSLTQENIKPLYFVRHRRKIIKRFNFSKRLISSSFTLLSIENKGKSEYSINLGKTPLLFPASHSGRSRWCAEGDWSWRTRWRKESWRHPTTRAATRTASTASGRSWRQADTRSNSTSKSSRWKLPESTWKFPFWQKSRMKRE